MKEYITDNLSLKGVQPDEGLPVEQASCLAQLTVAPTDGERTVTEFPVMSFHTMLGDPFDPKAKSGEMEISIGGFVNDLSPIQSLFVKSAQKIKFYTGQSPDPTAAENYPGAERLTIAATGRIGINSPSAKSFTTLDVREAFPSGGFNEPRRPRTSSISITQPYYKDKRGNTPPEFGHLFFMMNVDPEGDEPFPYSRITSGNDGFIEDSYRDKIANLQFFTNTGNGEGSQLKKHLEINGIEDKTKIFTQLNLGNVPVFRDQTEAVEEGRLVNGDVYQDRLQNLKIVFIPTDEERV